MLAYIAGFILGALVQLVVILAAYDCGKTQGMLRMRNVVYEYLDKQKQNVR